jgi:hypothetical protein
VSTSGRSGQRLWLILNHKFRFLHGDSACSPFTASGSVVREQPSKEVDKVDVPGLSSRRGSNGSRQDLSDFRHVRGAGLDKDRAPVKGRRVFLIDTQRFCAILLHFHMDRGIAAIV